MNRNCKVALIQETTPKTKAKALSQTLLNIEKAAAQGAELIVLQELHLTPYFCQIENPDFFDLAETIPGPSCQALAEIAKRLKIVLVASLFEKRTAGMYHNTAVVFEKDGNIAGKYRKMHIPDDPGYYEKFYFTPGDLGFQPIETSVGKLGILICWDQWFPEAARLMTLAGAEILIYPTAIGWDLNDDNDEQQRQLDAWITIQRSHAIANGIPLVSCNRVGLETLETMTSLFWGHSFICGPQGEILAKASIKHSDIIIHDIDYQNTEKVRRIWPFLRDRRINDYSQINQRFLD